MSKKYHASYFAAFLYCSTLDKVILGPHSANLDEIKGKVDKLNKNTKIAVLYHLSSIDVIETALEDANVCLEEGMFFFEG